MEPVEDQDMDCGAESRRVNKVREPGAQHKKDWAEHLVLHLPFRAWCPHCVKGAGQSMERRKDGERESRIPNICVDYMIL